MSKEQKKQGGHLIGRIHRLGGRMLAEMLKHHKIDEINPAQGRILFVLWQTDRITIGELAEKTSLEKSTLTSMLDRLESTGHIVRLPVKNDRRKLMIALTDKNKRLKEVYKKVSRSMTEIFYRGFTEEEIVRFESSLQKILYNLSKDSL